MINRKTVFIIGAGASKEFGLPTGAELKNEISDMTNFRFDSSRILSGERAIYVGLREWANEKSIDPDSLKYPWKLLSRGLVSAASIDNFLHTHQENEGVIICGKLAIALSILRAERNSALFVDPNSEEYDNSRICSRIVHNINSTYMGHLQKILFQGVKRSDVSNVLRSVTFVVFNYDRCVEQSLVAGLMNYFSIPLADAVSIVRSCNIFHPYGVIDALREGYQDVSSMGFGREVDGVELVSFAKRIKTFTEQIEEEEELVISIRKAVASCENLIFLGFGFHDINMKLIDPKEECAAEILLATAASISRDDCMLIQEKLSRMLGEKINRLERIRHDLHAHKLIEEYWHTISE